MSAPLILATDLDGTMADGSPDDRAELVALLQEADDVRLIYVTGRTPDAARALLARASLPEPDVLIADVGTTVLHGAGPVPVTEIEAELDRLWPGAEAVRARLHDVAELTPQEIEAPRRVSYWIEPVRERRGQAAASEPDPFAARAPDDESLDDQAAAIADRVAEDAAAALAPLDVDVLVSANVFLDVLPRGVNKGSTLRRVLRWLDGDDEHCVVAGDSLNDLALFETGLRGIVVGNCEPALRARVAHMNQVYRARGIGASGILEGLRHHGHFREASARGDSHGQ
ncbi:MAG: HAD-IIB family hydrolase [Longimicrobiales bacterium]